MTYIMQHLYLVLLLDIPGEELEATKCGTLGWV